MKGQAFVVRSILLLSLLLPGWSLAAVFQPIVLLGDKSHEDVPEELLIIEDPDGSMTPEQLDWDKATPMEPTLKAAPYSKSKFWLKFNVHNASRELTWILNPEYVYLDFKAFIQTEDGAIRPLVTEHKLSRIPFALVTIPEGETRTVIIRASTRYYLDLRFELMTAGAFHVRDVDESIFFALISGIFLALIIYNGSLLASLRNSNFVYYLFFAIVNGYLNLMSVSFPQGIGYWGGVDWFRWVAFVRPLAPLSTVMFARHFLETSRRSPLFDKFILAYMAGLVALMIPGIFSPAYWISDLQSLYFLIGVILLIVMGVVALRKEFTYYNLYYIIGVSTFALGMATYIAQGENMIPMTFFTGHAHVAGQAVEMLLMSLALGSKIKLLEKAHDHSTTTAEIKSRLLRVTSHDLANPLSIIHATAYRHRNNEHLSQPMQNILKAANMIQETLQLVAKTQQADRLKSLPLEAVEVSELFTNLKFLFQPRAAEKQIDLIFNEESEGLRVCAEKSSLRSEVMSNLISNAIKFSYPHSQIVVRARKLASGKIELSVVDKGLGMTEAKIATIFQHHANQSSGGTGGEKGTGFGMPLVKAYVDLYKASIVVESIINAPDGQSGTTVRIAFDQPKPSMG